MECRPCCTQPHFLLRGQPPVSALFPPLSQQLLLPFPCPRSSIHVPLTLHLVSIIKKKKRSSCISDFSFCVRKRSPQQPPGLRRSPGAEGDSEARGLPPAVGQDPTPRIQAAVRAQEARVWQQEDDLILFHSMKHVFLSKTNFPSLPETPGSPARAFLCSITRSARRPSLRASKF